jgi:hypothetical protein
MKAFQEDKGYPDLSFDRIFDATGRIAGLLSCHRIRLINPREELLVTMHSPETGKVQAILCVGTD